jgi:hypothetical protein
VKRAQVEAEMTETAGKINGMEVTITAKVGEKDRLYGSVTSADIADALSASAGLVIDKRKVELEEPIREIGTYEVTIRFTHDITAAVLVTVLADKVPEEKEEKKEDRKARARRERKAKAEAKAEEAEVQVEEPEAKVEEAEAEVKEPEAIVEEAEVKAEDEGAGVEEVEKKEAESGE